MTKRSALMLVPLAALLLGACNQLSEDPSIGPGQSREIVLSGSIGAYTRVSEQAFDAGDEAGLFIGSPVNVANVKITSDGKGGFSPSEKLYWDAEQEDDQASSFIAYYPFADVQDAASNFTFSMNADQSVAANYASADLLYAKTEAAPGDGTIYLPFNHVMSRFIISVDCNVEGHSINAVTVDGVKMQAIVNLAEGSFTADGEAVSAKAADFNGVFVLILAPQTAAPEITLSVSNGEEVSFTPKASMDFASGKQIRANLVLEMSGIESFEAEIEDWVGDSLIIQEERPGDSGEEHTWSIYNCASGETIALEANEDGILEARMYGYESNSPFLFVKDGAEYFGQVYRDYVIDNEEEVRLIRVETADGVSPYALYLSSEDELDFTVCFDPAGLTATFAEIPYDWESVGTGMFIDGFIAGLFSLPAQEVEVEIMSSPNYENTYGLDDPYSRFLFVSDYHFNHEPSVLVFVIKEDDTVYFKTSKTGLSYGQYGMFYAASAVPENGWTSFNYYGTLDTENNYISFYDISVTPCDVGAYSSNHQGMMAITLPGGTRPVRYYSLDHLGINVPTLKYGNTATVSISGEPQLDVAGVAYMVVAGSPEEEEINRIIADIAAGNGYEAENFVRYSSFGIQWECSEAGAYTAVLVTYDSEYTCRWSTTVSFEVEVSNYDYDRWLGEWEINGRTYTISQDVYGLSYLIEGFDGAYSVPLNFDAETGDILFYTGAQDSPYNGDSWQIYRVGYGTDLYIDGEEVVARFIQYEDNYAKIEPEIDGIKYFGLLAYNAESERLAYISEDDLILIPLEIYKISEPVAGAPAMHQARARSLSLPSDANTISKK